MSEGSPTRWYAPVTPRGVLNSTAHCEAMRDIPYVVTSLRYACVAVLWACAATAHLQAGQEGVVARARAMATSGQRSEAIALLQESVADGSADSDGRVLLGTVLSWEGRYDEARRELDVILDANPTHGDALPAMINVELWSNRSARAEELAARALRKRPNDTAMLLARARALTALSRQSDARASLDRALVIEPRNADALQMRRSMQSALRLWQVRVSTTHDGFSDQRAAWRESHVGVSRATPIGSVSFKAARAARFGLTDTQIEIEMYPRLRSGTYAYVSGAFSPNADLYPKYRYAVDLYQSLGSGFEGSAGYRRLGFGSGVHIYVGSLSKYYGDWLFTGRVFLTPNIASTSRSLHASVRRYVGGDGAYLGARYGRGAWREEVRNLRDLDALDSDVIAGEGVFVVRDRLELNVSAAYGREDRVDRLDLRQYSLSTGLGFRF
jgi:YaiO family outer membrane protein